MKKIAEGTKVMLTGTVVDVMKSTHIGEGILYGIDIDGDKHVPVYVSEEAVKIAPWFGDDGK